MCQSTNYSANRVPMTKCDVVLCHWSDIMSVLQSISIDM